MDHLSKLFEPTSIGALELKNRMVMSAMHTHFASDTGEVTEQLISYYAERARGGVGLIIIEATAVDFTGLGFGNGLMLETDERIQGLSKLVDKIKKEGARVGIQLHHAGLRADPSITKTQPLGPSKTGGGSEAMSSKEMNLGDIKRLIENFCEAARRARDAGFDAVELHGAHGYLLNQFLSPIYNKRLDNYGGSQEKRTELVCQIVKSIRETVGGDYPVLCKIPADEGRENGIDIADAIIIAKRLEESGVKGIDVSCGLSETLFSTMPMGTPQGSFVHLAHEIKKKIHIPVMTVGRIKDPNFASLVLQEGKADLIGMGRALIADPHLPRKVFQGELDEIRPCIGCNVCITRVGNRLPLMCAVNPCLGIEGKKSVKAKNPKKVLVVGGGPSGMEAAIDCLEKGHHVVLMEKTDHLGGLMNMASVPPQKKEIDEFKEYLSKKLKRAGVRIELGEEVNSRTLKQLNPDAVIIATGSEPTIPEIPGIERENVTTALDVLQGRVKPGRNVVVIGGGEVGLEVADHLSQQGIAVTVTEQLPQVGIDVPPRIMVFLIRRLHEKKVRIITEAKALEIKDNGVLLDLPGKQETLRGDQIIIATGMKSQNGLFETINQSLPDFQNIYVVGDAIKPRKILEAVREGFEVSELISLSYKE